jgi:mRNA interferase RelE/StbE
MAYSLNFTKRALKDLEKIKEPFYSQIKQAIQSLAENPRPLGYIKLKGRDSFRVRTGNYRIIYDIFDKELVVEIIALGDRKDIY